LRGVYLLNEVKHSEVKPKAAAEMTAGTASTTAIVGVDVLGIY